MDMEFFTAPSCFLKAKKKKKRILKEKIQRLNEEK